MLHRKFDNLKFKRTYIGGSKKRELEIFNEVQGTKDDNSECDWVEYRRIYTRYCDDTLNVILSWKYLLNKLSIIFLILTIPMIFASKNIGIFLLISSLVSYITFKYFKVKERKSLSAYDFSLDIILSAIKQETGFEFNKN